MTDTPIWDQLANTPLTCNTCKKPHPIHQWHTNNKQCPQCHPNNTTNPQPGKK